MNLRAATEKGALTEARARFEACQPDTTLCTVVRLNYAGNATSIARATGRTEWVRLSIQAV